MPEVGTYTGSCHCGAVRYEVELSLDQVISCNCSICRKQGLLLAFAPDDKFKLSGGEEQLTDYLFNRKVIHHLFCSTCGVSSFSRGTRPDGVHTVAINVRCLDGVDLDTLNLRKFDGAKL
ncbi:MAG: GFA family protein [Hyphomicrobium sp.]|jgi:hypothetical protein